MITLKYINNFRFEAVLVSLAFALFGGVAGFALSLPPFKKKLYKSSAKLVVPQSKFFKRTGVGREEYEGLGIGFKPDVRRMLAVLRSPETENTLIDSLGIAQHYGYSRPDESQWKEIYDIYRDNVRFDDPKSNYVLIEVWDESPAFARKMVQTLVGVAQNYWKTHILGDTAVWNRRFARQIFDGFEDQERSFLSRMRRDKRYHYDYLSEAVSRNLDFQSGHESYDELYAREYRLDVTEKHGAYTDARTRFVEEWRQVYRFAGELASSPVETRLSDKPDAVEFAAVGALGGALWGFCCFVFIRLIRKA